KPGRHARSSAGLRRRQRSAARRARRARRSPGRGWQGSWYVAAVSTWHASPGLRVTLAQLPDASGCIRMHGEPDMSQLHPTDDLPALEGPRIRLRGFREDDLQDFYEVHSDPVVNRYWSFP